MVRRRGQKHAFNSWERAPTVGVALGCWSFQRGAGWTGQLASPVWSTHEAFPLGLVCLAVLPSSSFGFAYILSLLPKVCPSFI